MITRAIGFEKKFILNEGNQFEYFQLMVPDLLPLDVLVKVEAASVNPVDTKLRQSGKGTVPPHILGFDGVGIILEKGSEVTNFSVGDRVLYAGTTTRTGSCSNLQVVDSRIIAQVPASMTLTDAAGMPLTFITAYEALFEKMGLIPEENANVGKELLIVNGAGGVGSAAIQLAKWAGLKVIDGFSCSDSRLGHKPAGRSGDQSSTFSKRSAACKKAGQHPLYPASSLNG